MTGDDTPHPFEIFWDAKEASYFIFVPDGCVLVNGVAATNDDVENGNLALDFGDTHPNKVYCHVSKSGESSWKFTVDGEETEDGADYNFLVSCFGEDENDGGSYDVVCSAISIGGKVASAPRPFDIVDDTDAETGDSVKKVVRCSIPCPIEVLSAGDYTLQGNNNVYIHVYLSDSGSYSLTVDQTSRDQSATHAQFKIYEFDANGNVTLDARPMALPLLAT